MGLSCSHDAFFGSYGRFNLWRNQLAEVAGYQITKFENKGLEIPQPVIDWGHVKEKNYQGKWEETPEDPLIVLITHSDCGGKIYPEQAEPLADRIEELIPDIEAQGWSEETIARAKSLSKKFVAGLRKAVENNEPLEFH